MNPIKYKSSFLLFALFFAFPFSLRAQTQFFRPANIPNQNQVRQMKPVDTVFAGIEWHNLRTVPFKQGAEASSKTLMCPVDAVVSGINIGSSVFSSGCGKGWKSGCGDVLVLGSVQLMCAKLPTSLATLDRLEWTSVPATGPSGEIQLGSSPLTYNESCLSPLGVATGVAGRAGDAVDSLGLSCGNYFLPRSSLPTVEASPRPYSLNEGGDYPFGAFPGFGGNVFDQKETTGEALVGISFFVNESKNQITGIQSLHYGSFKKKFVRALFPVEE